MRPAPGRRGPAAALNLLRTLSTVSGMTLLSRITGLARESLKAAVFGAGMQMDAFEAAFRLMDTSPMRAKKINSGSQLHSDIMPAIIPLPFLPLLASTTQNSPVIETAAGVTGVKTVVPLSASINEHLHFRIALTNTTNDPARYLEVIDDIPDFLTIVDVNTTENRGEVDIVDNRVKVLFSSLDTHRTVEIDIDTIVNNIAFGGFFYNSASFSYFFINDQFLGETNSIQYQITTGPPTPTPSGFPLAAQKTVSGSPAFQGDLLGFTIEIRNVGTGPADNLIIT